MVDRHTARLSPRSGAARRSITRREFSRRAVAFTASIGAGGLPGCAATKESDIRIEDITTSFEHYRYRNDGDVRPAQGRLGLEVSVRRTTPPTRIPSGFVRCRREPHSGELFTGLEKAVLEGDI